jgi:putative two-component system response regulator
MPEIDGFGLIRRLKRNPATKDIPVILLTGAVDEKSEIEGLSLGAMDYISKPIHPKIVKKRIDMYLALDDYEKNLEALVEKKTHTIGKLTDVTISTIISLIGTHDEETLGHIKRTSEYTVALSRELMANSVYADRISETMIEEVRRAAPLHDVGKIGVDGNILNKNGRLTEEEFDKIKLHTSLGGEAFIKAREMMGEPSFLDTALTLSYYHHEKWDGSGYPKGLKGEAIPLEARIMALADVYDALISKRPYKPPMQHADAVKIIVSGRKKHFDPVVCDAFKKIHKTFLGIAEQFK